MLINDSIGVAELQRRCDAGIDDWCRVRTAAGRPLFCGRGCSGCCSLYVETTLAEAQQIAAKFKTRANERIEAYGERLFRVAKESADLKSLLQRHRREFVCPFLDEDGACSIYPLRPLACRALLSTRPAEWCSVEFSTLSPLERELFRKALDPQATDGLTHYAAAPRDAAANFEEIIDQRTAVCFGAAVRGNLPILVLFARQFFDSGTASPDQSSLLTNLRSFPLNHPLLLRLSPRP